MCIFCFYCACLPSFSIYFEYRSKTNHSETIGNLISKEIDEPLLFINRHYDTYNLVEEYGRSHKGGSIFEEMNGEYMPTWERTRICVSYNGRFETVNNSDFTDRETIEWLIRTLHFMELMLFHTYCDDFIGKVVPRCAYVDRIDHNSRLSHIDVKQVLYGN